MFVYSKVNKNAYYDSVTLMLFSRKVAAVAGIGEAAVMMGTDHNKKLMIDSGVLEPEKSPDISANDLVIGMAGETPESLEKAKEVLDDLFTGKNTCTEKHGKINAKSLSSAVNTMGNSDFAIISLPGKYAKYEAQNALDNDLHVLLFSDNIGIEDEIKLKDKALEKGLLMMGPDCGTAIINGVALGFANIVNRGNIGIVSAAGTGLQEVTVLIDRLSGGISQAIGTGGRDTKDEIGGRMFFAALEALKNDDDTDVILIVTKPPGKNVLAKLDQKLKSMDKPFIVCLLDSLEDASVFTVSKALGKDPTVLKRLFDPSPEVREIIKQGISKLEPGQKYVRGLYSGGSLCQEALYEFNRDMDTFSNIGDSSQKRLDVIDKSQGNTLIDMGEDVFTDGMPHPMIDMRERTKRMIKEASDPETAVILFDCVLGFGAHDDPAGALGDAVMQAKNAGEGRHIIFIASVCGTDKDIQSRKEQVAKLEEKGVIVMESNYRAALAAKEIIKGLNGGKVDE